MDTPSLRSPVDRNLPGLSARERNALIQRIASSSHFRRSNRLREMLLFLGAHTADENQSEINEQEIGEKVFGRPAQYDRGQDNIVRVNASELRKRLELYFSTEGAHEPTIVSMPRGGYRLLFHSRPSSNGAAIVPHAAEPHPVHDPFSATSHVAPPAPQSLKRHPASWTLGLIAGALGLLLGIFLTVLVIRISPIHLHGSPAPSQPLVSAFWSEFSPKSSDIDLVLPDASLNITEYIIQRPISLADYINKDYYSAALQSHPDAERMQDIHQIFHHDIVDIGDFEAAQQFLSLAKVRPRIRMLPARVYTPDLLAQNSLILIGGEPANPWVGLFNKDLNFTLEDNDKNMLTYVANRKPRPGEQSSYNPTSNQNAVATGYGVLAFLPSPNHVGNVLIMAGTDAQTTKAVAEYVTSESKLSELQKKLGTSKIPYFEAVIQSSRISDTSFNTRIVALRSGASIESKN